MRKIISHTLAFLLLSISLLITVIVIFNFEIIDFNQLYILIWLIANFFFWVLALDNYDEYYGPKIVYNIVLQLCKYNYYYMDFLKWIFVVIFFIFTMGNFYIYVFAIKPNIELEKNIDIKISSFSHSFNYSMFTDKIIKCNNLSGSFAILNIKDSLFQYGINRHSLRAIWNDKEQRDAKNIKYIVVNNIVESNSETYNTKTTIDYHVPSYIMKDKVYYGTKTEYYYRYESFVYDINTKQCVATNYYDEYYPNKGIDYIEWLSKLFSISYDDINGHIE